MTEFTADLEGARTILLEEPPMGQGRDACSSLLTDGVTEPNVLFVTYTRGPGDCVEQLADEPVGTVGIITVGEESAPEREAIRVASVTTPSDLTRLGIEIGEVLSEWEPPVLVCFDSLTSMLQYVEFDTAYEFLHAITGRIYDAGARAHFHVDPRAHDGTTLAGITSLLDARITVDDECAVGHCVLAGGADESAERLSGTRGQRRPPVRARRAARRDGVRRVPGAPAAGETRGGDSARTHTTVQRVRCRSGGRPRGSPDVRAARRARGAVRDVRGDPGVAAASSDAGDGAVNCRIGPVVRCGRALPIERAVDPETLATAVREGHARTGVGTIAVEAPAPSPVHEHVGCIRPGMGLRRLTALARAARTRGLSTPQDEEIAAVREELADLEIASERTAEHRRTAAEARTDRDRLRETVAAARGRLEAARDAGSGTETAAAALEDAIRRLSEAETDATAARERLERARASKQARRDRRERQFRLEDRLANLQRDARADLVESVRDAYRDAVATVPSPSRETPGDVGPVTAALAIARVADCDAPLVLACNRFDTPDRASDVLDAPVLKIQVR